MTYSYPDIGYNSAREQLDHLLFPAYSQFLKQQTRANALAVAHAAWQIHERHWHDKGCAPECEKFRADLFKDCPELRLLRDWVETAKHAGLYRKDVKLASITGAENPGGRLECFGLPGTVPSTLECTLTIKDVDGRRYQVSDVLRRVVEFWKSKLQ